MKTTRDSDLDILTDRVDKNEADSVHVRAVRDRVYKQAKDPYLEKKRRELEMWIKDGLYAYSRSNGHPTAKDKEQMALSEMNIDRIEREIKLYTSSDVFQEELVRAIAKVSHDEAQVYLKQEGVL